MTNLDRSPILTVAVITYNQRDLLKETLNSILSQETEYSFEIAICDDASTDDTEAMCLEYQSANHGRVKYLRLEKNSGITANSNLGLQNCKGKYFALIGGDDLFLPGKIQKQISFMEKNPGVTISYHPVEIFDSSSGKTLLLTNQSSMDTPKTLLALARICIPGSVSVMVRGDAVPEGGFDRRLPTVSDWLFYLEVASKGEIGFLPQSLARYRKHGNQASFRTLELLEESLSNLDYAKQKLGPIPGLDEAILQGKARYLSGEAFRQLISGSKKNARLMFTKAQALHFKYIIAFAYIMTFIPIPASLFLRSRYFLKKIF